MPCTAWPDETLQFTISCTASLSLEKSWWFLAQQLTKRSSMQTGCAQLAQVRPACRGTQHIMMKRTLEMK